MITCPECGQDTDDDAKFCDRCGQGLASGVEHQTTNLLAPLAPILSSRVGIASQHCSVVPRLKIAIARSASTTSSLCSCANELDPCQNSQATAPPKTQPSKTQRDREPKLQNYG